ncbi:MAG: ABC transporter substrate-binding protein [Mycobacteriales bacterium]
MTVRHEVRVVRRLVALVVVVAAVLTLAACSNSSKQAKKDSGTVVLAEPGDNPGDIALRHQLAAAFMRLHPGVKVKVLIVPATNYDQKIQTMIAGGTPPDIFNSGDVQIPNIVDKNFALDLTPLVKRDHYSLSDFYPQVIDGLTYNKKLIGLTDNWDTQVMYYNTTLFKKADVAPPNAHWTWSDFVTAAQKLTSGSGTKKVYGALFENWFAAYFDQIWSWGGDPFPDSGAKCGYDSSQAVAAFNSIVNLYKSGTSPTPSQFSGQGAEQLFLSSRVAMYIGAGRWAAYDLRDVKRFGWKIAPIPTGPAGRANFFHLSMFAISRTSHNQDTAWEFLKFMVSSQGIKEGLAAAQGIPSRKSVAESATFKNSPFALQHDAVEPFFASLSTVHRAPFLPNFNEVQDTVDAQLSPVWSLKNPPSEALSKVCQKVGPLLKQGGIPGGH